MVIQTGARGPAPKDPEQLSHRSKTAADKAHLKVITSEPCPPPELPECMPGGDWDEDNEEFRKCEWPKETLYWWKCWIEDPMTADYRNSDWLDLLDCALIHGRLWSGDTKAAGELRLRLARHGATRSDRAGLRITLATADITEKKANETAPTSGRSAFQRRGGLKAVPAIKDDPAPF